MTLSNLLYVGVVYNILSKLRTNNNIDRRKNKSNTNNMIHVLVCKVRKIESFDQIHRDSEFLCLCEDAEVIDYEVLAFHC